MAPIARRGVMTRVRRWCALLCVGALGPLQAGCERRPAPVPPAETPDVVVRDSAGVRVVRAGFASDSLGPLLAVRDTLLNGADSAQAGVIGVVAVQPLAESSLVVLSAAGPSLLRYDGRPLRGAPMAVSGTAPGTFGSRATVLPYGRDTLVLWDANAGRVSWLTATGLFLHAQLSYPLSRLGTVSGVWRDGTVVGMTASPPGEQQAGVSRVPSALLRFGSDGALRDTLITFRGVERVVQVGRAGGALDVAPRRAVSVPFGRSTLWTVGPSSVLLLDTEGCRVERWDATGALVLRLELTCAVEAVTEADRARFLNEVLASARSRSDSTVRRRLVEEATFPPTKPTASGLLTDDWNRIWVRLPVREVTDDWRWWVFAADGTPLTSVRIARAWQIARVQATDLLVVSADRADAPPVVARLVLPAALRLPEE
jgi:hypothetical protein